MLRRAREQHAIGDGDAAPERKIVGTLRRRRLWFTLLIVAAIVAGQLPAYRMIENQLDHPELSMRWRPARLISSG